MLQIGYELIESLGTVKFDTDQLPPILNALETENAGQKLVLEVAVSCFKWRGRTGTSSLRHD